MKKNNYNIDLNPKQLSEKDIAKHKDFDSLLKSFEASPTPEVAPTSIRRYLYPAIAAAAACLVAALFVLNNNPTGSDYQTASNAHFASQPYVNPPLGDVQAVFTSNGFNATKGGVYKYKNGSKLIVPPAAFVDANGKIIEGEVDIRYREFHDYVDFFLSGIPMQYDSAGTKYDLESAGMIEIYAEQNGQRLNIRPGKEIDVELVSEIKVSDPNAALNFNIYRLDTVQRNWVYTGVDQIEVLEDNASDLLNDPKSAFEQSYNAQIAAIDQKADQEMAKIDASIKRPSQPIQPVRANGNDHVFNFDFADEDFNEDFLDDSNADQAAIEGSINEITKLRKQYKNTMWQIAPGNTNFNEEAASQISWDDMRIRQINNRDYELTLIGQNNQMKVIVNPVLTGNDFEQAMQNFNKEFQAYQNQITQIEAQLAEQKEALRQRIAVEKEVENKKYEDQLAAYRAKGLDEIATNLMVTKKIVNRFKVSNFGIWNCDRPLPPYMLRLKGEFVDNHKNTFEHNTAYLVDKNFNTVSRFYAKKGADVVFDEGSEKIMWVITKENKIAVFRPEQFKRINQKKGDYTFVLDLVDQEIKSEEDVRKILLF